MVSFPLPRKTPRDTPASLINDIAAAVAQVYPATAEEWVVGGPDGSTRRVSPGGTDNLPTIVNGQIVWQSRERINLRSHLSLTGTDEAATLQTLIDGLPSGSVLVLDHNANLGLGSQVAWSGKRVDLVGTGGARITETTALTVPILKATNAHKSIIGGFQMVGAETAFVGTVNPDHYAVEIVTSDDATVERLHVSGKSRGVKIDGGRRARVRDLTFVGLVAAWTTNVQYHTTLFVRNCDDADIADVRGIDCGSALLVGGSMVPQRGKANRITGRNCYDNGVYLSGGDGWTVCQAHISMAAGKAQNGGSGVKARGSGNTVVGCYAEGVDTGFVLSPYDGAPIDAFGAAASDSALVSCEAYNTRFSGASIDQIDTTRRPRDFQLIAVRARECGRALGADPGIRVIHGNRHTLALCQVIDHKANGPGILVGGSASEILTGIMVAFCKVRNCAGGAAAYGMQLSFVEACTIFGLELFGITTASFGLVLVQASTNEVTRTVAQGTVGTAAALRVDDVASTANRLIDNLTCTVSDAGTSTEKWGNANGNPTVTGSRDGNNALASLLTTLAAQRRIVDGTTA